ncbi:MAG: glycosyltransferase family 4 protein [Chloroflexi bacterium]|nr:glycosyltransferase family 4 protein [Chloroflexota bacterium]
MRRIAYCSPVNPVESGISDYSEELLPYLGQYAEVSLFVDRGLTPTNPALRRHLTVHSIDQLPALQRKQPFDAVIYHMGNSPAHGAIYEMSLQVQGVIVLHEWVLHHFKLWHAAERRKDVGAYLREMQQRYGAEGERVARKMSRGQLQDAAFRFPLVEDLIERAQGLIGHSCFVVDQARALRPTLPAAVVPMGVPLPLLLARDAAREQLGLPLDAPIWASFGHINPYKRMESALRAFKKFRAEQPNARYILVGSVSPSYDLAALIRRLALGDSVIVTGYAPRADFERYVAAADLCLNLRWPTAGETSASLLRLLGAGRPTLVSAVGSFGELPADVCAQVDADWSESALILAYARLLQTQPLVVAQLGSNARSYVAREHTLDGAAQGYIRFLSALLGWGQTPKLRDPLWQVEEPEIAAAAALSGPASSEAVALPAPVATTIAEVGTAAAELGLQETDDQPLREIAATLDDLLDDSPRQRRS